LHRLSGRPFITPAGFTQQCSNGRGQAAGEVGEEAGQPHGEVHAVPHFRKQGAEFAVFSVVAQHVPLLPPSWQRTTFDTYLALHSCSFMATGENARIFAATLAHSSPSIGSSWNVRKRLNSCVFHSLRLWQTYPSDALSIFRVTVLLSSKMFRFRTLFQELT
jgi:hypothetical protein